MDDNLIFRNPFEKWCTFGKHWFDTEGDTRKWAGFCCPDCRAAKQRKLRDNPEYVKRERVRENTPEVKQRRRFRRILSTYGITEQEFQQIYSKQNGICPICLTPLGDDIHIDHTETPAFRVRGLLHIHCNLAIVGHIEKCIKNGWLDNTLDYLNSA